MNKIVAKLKQLYNNKKKKKIGKYRKFGEQ